MSQWRDDYLRKGRILQWILEAETQYEELHGVRSCRSVGRAATGAVVPAFPLCARLSRVASSYLGRQRVDNNVSENRKIV